MVDGGVAPMIVFVCNTATLKNLNAAAAVFRKENAFLPANEKVWIDFSDFYSE